MSHFLLAIISQENADIDKIMEPFNEALEVEPYVAKTKRQLIKNARAYYKASLSYYIEKKEEMSGEVGDVIKEMKKLMNMTDSELYEYEKQKYDDEDFDRDGNLISIYNPNPKYDWYEIGGRWSDLLELKRKNKKGNPIKVNQAKIKDINFEPNEETYKEALEFWENYVEGKNPSASHAGYLLYKPEYYLEKFKTKENYAKETACFKTYAVITPDGEWHEEGEMLMFGVSTNEEEGWVANYKKRFLDNNENLMITIVDCHI
ncbi:hypothetical protein [Hungatella hathewayi]|uniref:hypothetical protein n=1 Tax=Hungatella hathewayi TaxID=154046 RepID=UPI003569E7A1